MDTPDHPRPVRDNLALAEFQAQRAEALAALPRQGTSPIKNLERFRFNLEEIALGLGDKLAARIQAKDPNWWQLQDTLDDVMDALDALRDPELTWSVVRAPPLRAG